MNPTPLSLTLAILTVITQIFAIKILVVYVFRKRLAHVAPMRWLKKIALPLAFLIALAGVVGSLIYSNIIGFDPCVLCWWQRIFLYPLVPILGVALFRRDHTNVVRYALPLTVIGAGFSTYHYIIQRFTPHVASCDVMGQSASCAGFYVFEFGYITIPLMCLTAFVAIMGLLLFVNKK